MAQKQNFGLGRGLGSLIPSKREEPASDERQEGNYFSARAFKPTPEDPPAVEQNVAQSIVRDVPVGDIASNEYQPRKHFAEKPLEELSASIKEHGILQPLVVIEKEEGGYELVAGERRLRASKMAGLSTVPVIVRNFNELERLELALIENIQRADLNPIEEAVAYQKLNDEFGLTHEQIAKRLGKSRPVVSNALRLLHLPEEIQQAIAEGKITEGHAKVLMEIKDEAKRDALFKKVLSQKLTITDTSSEVQRVGVQPHSRRVNRDPNIAALEDDLRDRLGTKVSIKKRGKHGGVIAIEYYGQEEFRELLEKLTHGS